MAQHFIACDREQVLLLPSVRDWLPDDHFALFVIDADAHSTWRRSMGHLVAMAWAARRTIRR